MNQTEPVRIELSKGKLIFLFCIGILFTAGGIWMVRLDASFIESQRRFNSPIFIHGVGLFLTLFSPVGIAVSLRKLFDPSPGLMLDSRGITDNSRSFSTVFVPWSDIRGIEVKQIQSQKLIYLLLKDPDKYIESCTPIKRALLRASKNMATSPISISAVTLKTSFEELLALVEQHMALHKSGA
jgi:hypothetical protein